jgi:hypothetical protein
MNRRSGLDKVLHLIGGALLGTTSRLGRGLGVSLGLAAMIFWETAQAAMGSGNPEWGDLLAGAGGYILTAVAASCDRGGGRWPRACFPRPSPIPFPMHLAHRSFRGMTLDYSGRAVVIATNSMPQSVPSSPTRPPSQVSAPACLSVLPTSERP